MTTKKQIDNGDAYEKLNDYLRYSKAVFHLLEAAHEPFVEMKAVNRIGNMLSDMCEEAQEHLEAFGGAS